MTERQKTAMHEAAHCAMALWWGHPVRAVSIDRRYPMGFSIHSHNGSRRDWTNGVMITLAALVEDAESLADLPTWPIDPDAGPPGQRSDRKHLAEVVAALGLSEDEYFTLERAAITISHDELYRALVNTIALALGRFERIEPELLRRIVAIVEGAFA